MAVPGFTAELSLGMSSWRYFARGTAMHRHVMPQVLLPPGGGPPQISVAYGAGPGPEFGELTITGQGFHPDSDVFLTIDPCDGAARPITVIADTTPNTEFCDFGHFSFRLGGYFTASVICWCGGGTKTVTATDVYGNSASVPAS